MTEIVAIAVVGRNRVIGDGTDQPFKIAEDWKRFKATTMGHPLVVGRATFEAIGRHLPGRTMVVVSRHPERVDVGETGFAVASPQLALALAEELDDDVAFVAGGGEIYRALLGSCDRLLLTEVVADAEGEVTFPELGDEWVETEREPREGYAFVTYERAP